MMEILNKNIVAAFVFIFPALLLAATPTEEHQAFTRAVNNAIEWSKHVKTEVSKGKKMNKGHTTQEIHELQGSINQMTSAYSELSQQPAAEIAEGHFVAIKEHQAQAQKELNILGSELEKPNPNYSTIKNLAKRIESSLALSSQEHLAELNEMDIK